MKQGALKAYLLILGWEYLPKSWSLHGVDPSIKLLEPVPAVLVQVSGGWILLDTGFNPALIKDQALYRRFHGRFQGIEAILPPGDSDPLLVALENHNLGVDNIKTIGLSHLHNDHVGGLRHFVDKAHIYIQKKELEYGLSNHPVPESNGIFRIDFDDPLHEWRLLAGEAEIAPGVTAIPTPGHTLGHQSFEVRFDDSVGGGGIIFAFDAADLTENIIDELPIGGVIDCDPRDSIEQIKMLKARASSKGYSLIPGHDPIVLPKLQADLIRKFK